MNGRIVGWLSILESGHDLPCRTRTHRPYWTIRIGVKSRVVDPGGLYPDLDPTGSGCESDYRDITGFVSGSYLILTLLNSPFTFSFDIKANIDILILYYNFCQQILQEKVNFRVILNLDVQARSGSDQVLKTRSGSATLAKRFAVRIFGRRMQIFLAGFTQPEECSLHGASVLLTRLPGFGSECWPNSDPGICTWTLERREILKAIFLCESRTSMKRLTLKVWKQKDDFKII